MLYNYNQVKWCQKENRFLLTGYLKDQTTKECVWNFSRISNQLVNIWTHALAVVYVVSEMINDVFYEIPQRHGDSFDKFAFAFFDFALLACLLSSVLRHSFNSHRCGCQMFFGGLVQLLFRRMPMLPTQHVLLVQAKSALALRLHVRYIVVNFTLLYFNSVYACVDDLNRKLLCL